MRLDMDEIELPKECPLCGCGLVPNEDQDFYGVYVEGDSVLYYCEENCELDKYNLGLPMFGVEYETRIASLVNLVEQRKQDKEKLLEDLVQAQIKFGLLNWKGLGPSIRVIEEMKKQLSFDGRKEFERLLKEKLEEFSS